MRNHRGVGQETDRASPGGAPLTAEELAAYEALVRKYGSYVYNIAYRICGSDADAKDLAQEAFIRVFRAFRRIDPEASLEAWLYRIVRNLHIDLIRKYPRGREESLSAPVQTPQGGEVQREWPSPERETPEAVVEAQLDATIQQALLALPVELRLVVVLSDVEGYAYEEIARMLEIPLGTVKSRLHRARKVLAARLAPVVGARPAPRATPGTAENEHGAPGDVSAEEGEAT